MEHFERANNINVQLFCFPFIFPIALWKSTLVRKLNENTTKKPNKAFKCELLEIEIKKRRERQHNE